MCKKDHQAELAHRRLQGLAELASAVTHKMNNELTAVTCNLSLILEDLAEGSPIPEDTPEILQDAFESAQKASKLSSEALGLFRLDLTHAKKVMLNAFLQRAKPIAQGNLKPQWFLFDNETSVLTKPELLDRMIDPVLENILELNLPVPVAITTERLTVPSQMQLGVDPLVPGSYVRIGIRDQGPGIGLPEQTCFQPFTTTKGVGRGLGLSIALNIARAHGGTMGCRNHSEGGAEVSIWLPLAD